MEKGFKKSKTRVEQAKQQQKHKLRSGNNKQINKDLNNEAHNNWATELFYFEITQEEGTSVVY